MNTLHDPDPMLALSESRQGTPVMQAPQPLQPPFPTQEPKKLPVPHPTREDVYPDLYLHIYMDSVSADNNPMILVELNALSCKYGPTVYPVGRVNSTMYGRFNRGFRVISERATLEPQYINTPLAGMYGPVQAAQMSTLSGQTQLVTPLAKSTPVTQSSQAPMILPRRMSPVRDILELVSTEQARPDCLERQIQHIGSIPRSPPDVSSNGLVPQSQDGAYRPQSRGMTPVIENTRDERGQQKMGAVTHEANTRGLSEEQD